MEQTAHSSLSGRRILENETNSASFHANKMSSTLGTMQAKYVLWCPFNLSHHCFLQSWQMFNNELVEQVVYDADSFLEKNRDTFSPNLREVMLNSQNEFIKDLFQAELAENGGLSRYAANCITEFNLPPRLFCCFSS